MPTVENSLTVIPVQTSDELERFIRFPWQIYQDDPCWVPPLLPQQRRFLDPRTGPFFAIGQARYFLAYRLGRPVGRVSAHINFRYDNYHDNYTGFFGFFESVPDQEVAAALFKAAAAWLRQQGRTRLVGPMNFTVYDEMGLLVEGFDTMPAIFQTHNPSYYQELLTNIGFRKAMDWVGLRLTERNIDTHAMEEAMFDIINRSSLTFTTYSKQELARRAEEALELFNQAWAPNWGHVPVARIQFEAFLKELKPLLRPELVTMILDGDRLAAFSIVIPDLNPLVQKFNGRLNWWRKIRLLYEAKWAPIRKARALVLGVSQPYQRRRLHHAMIMRFYLYLVRHTPCEFCDISLVPANLTHWLKVLESFGAQRYKLFRVFEKNI